MGSSDHHGTSLGYARTPASRNSAGNGRPRRFFECDNTMRRSRITSTACLIEAGERHGSVTIMVLLITFIARAHAITTPLHRASEWKYHSSVPGDVCCPAALQPRCDMLSREEASQMCLELLGGQHAPIDLPESIAMALASIDTGCGKSMGYHIDQFQDGSMCSHMSSIVGASGTFMTHECGELRLPIQTESNGIRAHREHGAIYNPACAYVLLSIGRASIDNGVSLTMPAWGGPGKFTYPSR